jgi:hypothetical protein
MIAVLVDSVKKGTSCMIAVRQCRKVRVSGLDGDVVRVLAFNGSETPEVIVFLLNGEQPLPEGCVRVCAEHDVVGKGRVFVDLTR